MNKQPNSTDVVRNAEEIARLAHAGQFRRDGVRPYIVHPQAVAARVSDDAAAQAVAWLHDVLEDTRETAGSLGRKGIPADIIASVDRLTKRKGVDYEAYLQAVREDPVARRVKVADMLANLSDEPTERQIRKYARGLLILLDDHA